VHLVNWFKAISFWLEKLCPRNCFLFMKNWGLGARLTKVPMPCLRLLHHCPS
jgi:hypothetical protein